MRRCLQFYQFCALLWTHSWRNKNCALRPALRERREQDNHRCLLNVKRIYGENFLGGFWWTWSKTSLSSNVIFAETTSELPATTNLSDKKAEHEMSAEASNSNLKRVSVHLKVLLPGKAIKSHSLWIIFVGLDLTASAGLSCEKSEHTAVTETSEV